jgi:hypothetical protein
MTRKIAAGCFAAMFGLAVSAGAQTPPSPQTPQTPPTTPPSGQSTMDRAGKDTKITGCVQAGTSAGSYELTNVKKSGATESTPPSGSPSSAPGASASGASSSAPVKIVAAAGVDLASHVGHTIEASGSWKSGGGASAEPSPGGAPGASASKADKEFEVKSVKMVSSTCSGGTN